MVLKDFESFELEALRCNRSLGSGERGVRGRGAGVKKNRQVFVHVHGVVRFVRAYERGERYRGPSRPLPPPSPSSRLT